MKSAISAFTGGIALLAVTLFIVFVVPHPKNRVDLGFNPPSPSPVATAIVLPTATPIPLPTYTPALNIPPDPGTGPQPACWFSPQPTDLVPCPARRHS